jgi:hypothetical protein
MADNHQNCPYCGATLPYVLDAFCSECRNPLDADSWPQATRSSVHDAGVSDAPATSPAASWLFPINVAGYVIIAASFLPALAVCHLLGDNRDGAKLAIGGPLVLLMDLAYRLRFKSKDFLSPAAGGKFLYLPLWPFGIFWSLFGLWQLSAGAPLQTENKKDPTPQTFIGCWHIFVPKELGGPHHEFYEIRADNSVTACFLTVDDKLIARFQGRLEGNLILSADGELRVSLRTDGDSLVIRYKKEFAYSRIEGMPAECR